MEKRVIYATLLPQSDSGLDRLGACSDSTILPHNRRRDGISDPAPGDERSPDRVFSSGAVDLDPTQTRAIARSPDKSAPQP